jgi:hypothetical protein
LLKSFFKFWLLAQSRCGFAADDMRQSLLAFTRFTS